PFLERLEDRRLLTYTSAVTGTTAIMTGDVAGDILAFDAVGGLLRHNRATAGDPDFNSDFDFDTTQLGDQTLAGDGTAVVTVNAGDGGDTIDLADGITLGGPVDGGAGTDTLDYGDYTTSVAANLGLGVTGLTANLQADQEVPANSSTATG